MKKKVLNIYKGAFLRSFKKNLIINNFIPKIYYFKNIFFQSMPIIISICGYSVASAIVFKYAGLSGEYAAAGYGVGTRIEQVVLLPILGINTAIITIIAQNFGAKNTSKSIKAFTVDGIFCENYTLNRNSK